MQLKNYLIMIVNFGINIDFFYYVDDVDGVKVFRKNNSVFVMRMLCNLLKIVLSVWLVFDKLVV